jgi:hypothetical protein
MWNTHDDDHEVYSDAMVVVMMMSMKIVSARNQRASMFERDHPTSDDKVDNNSVAIL